jgi:hypothetical protein
LGVGFQVVNAAAAGAGAAADAFAGPDGAARRRLPENCGLYTRDAAGRPTCTAYRANAGPFGIGGEQEAPPALSVPPPASMPTAAVRDVALEDCLYRSIVERKGGQC